MNHYQRLTRRNFLTISAGLSGMGLVTVLGESLYLSKSKHSIPVTINVNPNQPGIRIPSNFIGLSFEASGLPQSPIFRPDNTLLKNFVKQLGNNGILRIGANTVDNTYWIDGKPKSVTEKQIITKKDINNLFDFAETVGWKVILGLNLAKSNPEIAASQAKYVVRYAENNLLSLQIGNEPDLYPGNGLRLKTYNYKNFYEEFNAYFNAIRNRVPNAPISGPATALGGKDAWALPFAKDMASKINLLTQHYYRMGPPKNPAVTISNLLKHDQRLENIARNLRKAAQQNGLQYRIAECNSVYHGGKASVSNAFAAALWGLDLMFTLAQNGAAGVNFHVAGHYAPFAINKNREYSARPLYYGMLLFKLASQGRLLPVTISKTNINLKAYAVLAQNKNVLLTLLNKDETQNVEVLIDINSNLAKATALRLIAPSLNSTSDIILGGDNVESDGFWEPRFYETIQRSGKYYSIIVPAGSSVLITLS